jgi:hypothetical protein
LHPKLWCDKAKVVQVAELKEVDVCDQPHDPLLKRTDGKAIEARCG